MADIQIPVEQLWDARYLDPGGFYTLTGVTVDGGTTTTGGMRVEVPKNASWTFTADDAGKRFVATTASIVATTPEVGILGNGWEVELVNDSGGTIVVNGPGPTNVTMNDGDVATVMETNGRQRVSKVASTEIADLFSGTVDWTPLVFGENFDLVRWWDAQEPGTVILDVTTGLVTQWNDKIQFAATGGTSGKLVQTTVGHQPAFNTDEIRFNGTNLYLTHGSMGRAGYENKWFCMLFRINWTAMATSADNFLVGINGTAATMGQQLPSIKFKHLTKQLEVRWRNTIDNTTTVTVPGADDTWHTLISRRDETGIYTSIDGAAEIHSTNYANSMVDTGSSPTGFVGLNSTTTVTNWGIDSWVQGQGVLTTDDVAKMHAWGMWRRGNEANLDASSPYLLAAPTMTRADVHVEVSDSYADGYRFPTSGGWDDSTRGTALNLTGFTRTFHDHFTSITTITDGYAGGSGPWWAPAHIDTSGAKFRRPGQTPTDTYTILGDGTTLQIKMQQIGGTGAFYSGHLQTVDDWGNGFAQSVPNGGSCYYEARMAFNGNGTSDGSVPGWPAFWLYNTSSLKDTAASKAEIDIVEAYGASGTTTIKQMHMTAHCHSAYRPQPGNEGSPGNTGLTTRTPSKITDITQAPFSSPTVLFDGNGEASPGNFHTYGCMIDETWITWYFDGKVVSRFPVYKEALSDVFMLVSLQSQDLVSPVNAQTYLWVDYIDAYSIG